MENLVALWAIIANPTSPRLPNKCGQDKNTPEQRDEATNVFRLVTEVGA